MNRARGRYRSVLLFLGAAAVLFANALPAAGSLLRDIRIGEYQSSTRIVLEFDSEPLLTSPPRIDNGVLIVTLATTHPKLVRRIPFENTERISNLEIIAHKDDNLEIHLMFSPWHHRLKWFQLKDPFRLVMDVEIGEKTTAPKPAVTSAGKKPHHVQTQMAHGYQADQMQVQKITPAPPTARTFNPQQDSSSPGNTTSEPGKTNADHHLVDNTTVSEKVSNSVPPTPQSGPEQKPAPRMPVFVPSKAQSQTAIPGGSNLQFYLVGGLVLLTIIILGLLASIVLSRHKNLTSREQLAIDELLRRQEKRLKIINAQIDEEMQKFDKI